jgi:osmotically-inducible protein OsmY
MTQSRFSAALTAVSLVMYMILTGSFTGLLSVAALAQEDGEHASLSPDNTGINKRDRSSQEQTADQAGGNIKDRDVMQKIRKAVIADKSLSSYAHNIKIISENGHVTLKGPVRSTREKKNIEAKAVDIVGADYVTNHLSVKRR